MARPPAPAALIALFALAAAPGVARAQGTRFPAPRFRVEAGAALPINAYVDDQNGAEVTGGVAPFLGAVAAFAVGRNTSVDVGGRFSRGPVSVEASGTSLDADPVVHADLVAGIAWQPSARLTLHAGGGLSRVTGDDRVVPFRDGNASPWHPSGELGAAWRLSVGRPFSLALTAQGTRLGETSATDPVRSGGTVTRLLVGVRYGR